MAPYLFLCAQRKRSKTSWNTAEQNNNNNDLIYRALSSIKGLNYPEKMSESYHGTSNDLNTLKDIHNMNNHNHRLFKNKLTE